MRDDVRVYNDPETKLPIQLAGFESIRVLVPRKTPWFYENITGLKQRLVNSFSFKTFSPKPKLILAGCTGTAAFLPFYKGVPCAAIPALHKLEEQISTENMVGCTIIKIAKEVDYEIHWKVYDLRTAIFNERELALPDNLSACHKRVLDVLKAGGASKNSIRYWINTKVRKPWSEDKVKECLGELLKKTLVTYNKRENWYAIEGSIVSKARVTLDELFHNSRKITTVDSSCEHSGALKTMYWTMMEEQVRLGMNADAIILNGDATQGISHNYEYNGELLPIMNGSDKHQVLAALIRAKILMDIFERRFELIKKEKLTTKEIVKKCLIVFAYKYGNHDEPRFNHGKESRPLGYFDEVLRRVMLSRVLAFLEGRQRNHLTHQELENLVNERIIRIGESRVFKLNGVPVGVKHPYQARTQSKGTRIQQTSQFYDQYLRDWPDQELQNLCVVKVANFHEAAAVFMGVFGKTYFGVMTGAQVYDTLFEANQNKVVDHGVAKTEVEVNEAGQLLSGSVYYSNYISKKDRRILFTDELSTQDVSRLCLELSELFNMPWR